MTSLQGFPESAISFSQQFWHSALPPCAWPSVIRRMARRRLNADDVPLEIRSRMDWAWYDGTISRDGSKVRFHFKGFDSEEDELWDEKFLLDPDKLTDLVRLRSKQLQDTDCAMVRRNMIVCAMFQSADHEELKYFDARVMEVRSGSHVHAANRQQRVCNCTFVLKWAEGPDEREEVSVGCGDISFVDEGSIAIHPVAGELMQEGRKKGTPASRGGRKKCTPVSPGAKKKSTPGSRGTEQLSHVNTDDTGELSPDYAKKQKTFDAFLTKLDGACTSFEAALNEYHGEVVEGASVTKA